MEPQYTSRRRHSRASYTDDEEQANRMSDLEGDKEFVRRRRSSSTSLPASPSSSSYKMSVDSDDARSTSSMSIGRQSNSNHSRQATPVSFLTPLAEQNITRRLQQNRPISDLGNTGNSSTWPSFDGTSKHSRSMYDVMIDEPGQQDDSTSGRSRRPLAQPKGQHGPMPVIPSVYRSNSTELRRDPERRSVTRRSSLLPKSRALARVLTQAEEDTHLADIEMRREQETTHQIKERLGKSSMDTDGASKSEASVPPAAWARLRDIDSSPNMAPYQCSKLNPEMEMTNFQFDNLPSPVQQTFRSVKRKASEDRLFEPYPAASLKRRAVSPSVSLSGSPVLMGISSPPGVYASYYGSSPTSSTANAAARAQQKPGQLTSSSFNLHDASGGLSRMSLSE
ncbi:hypothetical protein DFQ28_008401 [Apophysomyces sp. BC1034]|nr:hypothetical protein DFQ30_007935 [Apophysomyces sp. BC1015]KAG0181874.1 hypothetical protein DFQ29_006668 [Apophysomyces sp. BC1021]KAG0192652.1 hypothetical protein DFQ28_008401 [Apophysomyces sp. BC1034]